MKTFTVTDQHLALARKMWVSWDPCEFGAPEIDPKRPYGNSDVLQDIAEILAVDVNVDAITDEDLEELHKQMETALQVFLATGTFAAGDYEADSYDINWRRIS